MESSDATTLRGKKGRNVYTKVYEVHNTVFTDQNGQFTTQSQNGNKYIMVMFKINSHGILVEDLNSQKDVELTRAYRSMMERLRKDGIAPKKHVLDNEVSDAVKTVSHSKECKKVLPQNKRSTKRTPEPITEEFEVNQAQADGKQQ